MLYLTILTPAYLQAVEYLKPESGLFHLTIMCFYCVCSGITWIYLAVAPEFITVTTVPHEMRLNCR